MRRSTTLACIAVVGVTSILAGAGCSNGSVSRTAKNNGQTTAAVSTPRVPSGAFDGAITNLQTHLRTQPKDARGWAQLGVAYVEQARLTADGSYYTKADQVLATSLRIQPRDNPGALAARAALAAARHEFSEALRLADAALAINPYDATALSVRTDALTELGRYSEALRAAVKADQTRPTLATFTRMSYQRELRGDIKGATSIMRNALLSANSPSDVVFVRFHLGSSPGTPAPRGPPVSNTRKPFASIPAMCRARSDRPESLWRRATSTARSPASSR